MYDLAGENGLDLEALRARLQRMSDRELLWFGWAARYMCSPAANLGKEPRQVFVIPVEGSGEGMGTAEDNHQPGTGSDDAALGREREAEVRAARPKAYD